MTTVKNDKYQPRPFVELQHPEWSRTATIYQVNLRQYTPEGTFKAFAKHLPRLKKMGADILWLMPIHPIGQKNRKGTLGSPYAVKDYYAVNSEFGSMQDFEELVNEIHNMGLHIILDWVANHSAWDHPLATEHPEWYSKTREGNFQPTPWYDWDDVIDFDYNQPGLREYMTEAMKFWVREKNIDGYRCDVAGFVPTDFWETVRHELDAIKPVFMLAEWESRDLYKKSFDATYSWTLWEAMKEAILHQKNAKLVEYFAHDVSTVPRNAYHMLFTDNHDKNAWEGTQFSNFGNGLEAAIVLTGVVNGMPLCYSGQEAGLDRSLKFFERDTIDWKPHRFEEVFSKIFHLKHANKALQNGKHGGVMVRIPNDQQHRVISFSRESDGHKVLAVFNFSSEELTAVLDTRHETGIYENYFDGGAFKIFPEWKLKLSAFDYLVLTHH